MALVKAGVKPPGAVAFRECGKRYGMHARPAELHEQTVFRHLIRKSPVPPLKPHVRRRSPMAYDAVVNPVLSADHGRPGWQARGVGAIIIVKSDTFPCNIVHYRRGIPSIAVTAHMIRPQCVNIEHKYSHPSIPLPLLISAVCIKLLHFPCCPGTMLSLLPLPHFPAQALRRRDNGPTNTPRLPAPPTFPDACSLPGHG